MSGAFCYNIDFWIPGNCSGFGACVNNSCVCRQGLSGRNVFFDLSGHDCVADTIAVPVLHWICVTIMFASFLLMLGWLVYEHATKGLTFSTNFLSIPFVERMGYLFILFHIFATCYLVLTACGVYVSESVIAAVVLSITNGLAWFILHTNTTTFFQVYFVMDRSRSPTYTNTNIAIVITTCLAFMCLAISIAATPLSAAFTKIALTRALSSIFGFSVIHLVALQLYLVHNIIEFLLEQATDKGKQEGQMRLLITYRLVTLFFGTIYIVLSIGGMIAATKVMYGIPMYFIGFILIFYVLLIVPRKFPKAVTTWTATSGSGSQSGSRSVASAN